MATTRRSFLSYGALILAGGCGATLNEVSGDGTEEQPGSPAHDGYLTVKLDNPDLFGDRNVAMGTKAVVLHSVTLTASPDQDLVVSSAMSTLMVASWKSGQPVAAVPSALGNFRLQVGSTFYTGDVGYIKIPGIGNFSGPLTNLYDDFGKSLIIPKGQSRQVKLVADVSLWAELAGTRLYDSESLIHAQAMLTGFTYQRPGSTASIPVPLAPSNQYSLYRSTLRVQDTAVGLSTTIFGAAVRVLALTFTAAPQAEATVYGLLVNWHLDNVRANGATLPYKVYMVDPPSPNGLVLVGGGNIDVLPTGTTGSYKDIFMSRLGLVKDFPVMGIKIPAGESRVFFVEFNTATAFSPPLMGHALLGAKLLGWTWSDGTFGSPTPALSFPGQFDPVLVERTIKS